MKSRTRRSLVAGAAIAALVAGATLGFLYPATLLGVAGWAPVVVAVL